MPYSGEAKKFEPEVKSLFRRSKQHLQKHSAGWAHNRKLMYGKLTEGVGYQGSGIAEAYGLYRSLVSNVLVSSPDPYFETTKEEFRQIASLLGDAVTWDFQIGSLYPRLVKALWQNFPYGFGVIAEDMHTKFLGKDKNKFIDKQRYFWKNIPVRDIMFDPDGFQIDLEDHRYIFVAYYISIGDMKRAELDGEKEYFNLENIDNFPIANEGTLNSDRDRYFSQSGNISDLPSNTNEVDPDYRQIKVWRCYDRVMDCVADICDHDRRFVRYEDWPYKIDIQGVRQFPARLLAMNTESDDFYPTPEIELIKPQLKNLIKLNDQLMTDMTTKIRAYIGLSPYVDQTKMGKLLDPKNPNKFLVSSNLDQLNAAANPNMPKVDSASDLIAKIQDIEPDPNIIPAMGEIRQQIQRISAYGEPQRGGLPQIRSAKEAARVADASQKSLLGRQSYLEDFMQSLTSYHVQLLKKTTSPSSERYYRITDKLGAMGQWKKYNPNEIPDEKDLFCQIYVGSSTPKTLDSKRAQTLQEIQIMKDFLKENQLSTLPLLYRYAEVFQVKHIDSFMKNQKGAATMLYGALIRAGQLGKQAPPELMINPIMEMVDAILDPSEKDMVKEAVLSPQKPGQGGSSGGSTTPAPDSYKATGNASGAVDLGSTQ